MEVHALNHHVILERVKLKRLDSVWQVFELDPSTGKKKKKRNYNEIAVLIKTNQSENREALHKDQVQTGKGQQPPCPFESSASFASIAVVVRAERIFSSWEEDRLDGGRRVHQVQRSEVRWQGDGKSRGGHENRGGERIRWVRGII